MLDFPKAHRREIASAGQPVACKPETRRGRPSARARLGPCTVSSPGAAGSPLVPLCSSSPPTSGSALETPDSHRARTLCRLSACLEEGETASQNWKAITRTQSHVYWQRMWRRSQRKWPPPKCYPHCCTEPPVWWQPDAGNPLRSPRFPRSFIHCVMSTQDADTHSPSQESLPQHHRHRISRAAPPLVACLFRHHECTHPLETSKCWLPVPPAPESGLPAPLWLIP